MSRARGAGAGRRVGSMPPEKHLGLGSSLGRLLQSPLLPPSSIKGSSGGCASASGSKRKASDFCFSDSKYIPSILADLKPPETIPASPPAPMDNEDPEAESDSDVKNEDGEL